MGKITEDIKKSIKVIENFPIKGIQFQDIFSLTNNPKIFGRIVNEITKIIRKESITKIVGIEARGFIFGAAAAVKSNIPFVAIRKPGKLPGKTIKQSYKLEYGKDAIEIQHDAILKKDKILLIDDLIATGGTAIASCKLLKKLNNKMITAFFVINLYNLKGTKKLFKENVKVVSLYETIG